MYLQKLLSLSFTSFARFTSSWSLFFLTPYLRAQPMLLYTSEVAHPCFLLLCTPFLFLLSPWIGTILHRHPTANSNSQETFFILCSFRSKGFWFFFILFLITSHLNFILLFLAYVFIFFKSSNITSPLICADTASEFKIHWNFVKVISIYSLESMLNQCNCGGLKKCMCVMLQLNPCIIALPLIGYTWGSFHLVSKNMKLLHLTGYISINKYIF